MGARVNNKTPYDQVISTVHLSNGFSMDTVLRCGYMPVVLWRDDAMLLPPFMSICDDCFLAKAYIEEHSQAGWEH
jgi:hypothetical protein